MTHTDDFINKYVKDLPSDKLDSEPMGVVPKARIEQDHKEITKNPIIDNVITFSTKIKRLGNSYCLPISKKFLESHRIELGEEIKVSIKKTS